MGEGTFISQFHTLPGKTVKEKQQNLFQLFLKYSSLRNNAKELDVVTANLDPKNHLEKIFYIDFLIYFRRFNELYAYFKSGDDITIKKVSKHEWFYQSAYKDVDTDEFVGAILPTLSYSLKKKILRKIQANQNHADKLFDSIQKRYGIHLAADFLPKCTTNKIREALRNNPIKLSQRQLQILYKNDPELIYVYFEERFKHEEDTSFLHDNRHILVYIAQRNPQMFSNLFDKYKLQTKLGRRTTKNYIISQKGKVTKQLEDYIVNLNHGMVVKKLGAEIKSIFFKTSKEKSQLYWEFLLRHYPKSRRFAAYRTSYDSIFHEKFDENIDAVSENMLKMISDPKERDRIAKLKYEKDANEDYLKYVTPEYCFEFYMDKINYMRCQERAKFVQIATECCVLSEDLNSLLKICELVAVRFKNDNSTVHQSFFTSLQKNLTLMDRFTEQHWKFIMEILDVANLNCDWVFGQDLLRVKHMEFSIKNNYDIKKMIATYNWIQIFYVDHIYDKSTLCKSVINELIETGCLNPSLITCDNDRVEKYDCRLAGVCKIYNERNPNDVIPIYDHPRVLKSVRHILQQSISHPIDFDLLEGIKYIICRQSSSKEIEEIKNLYFRALSGMRGADELLWFLKHEPETVHKNMNHFIEFFKSSRCTYPKCLWRYFKKYPSLEFDKKIVESCKLRLGEEGPENTSEFSTALAILDTPDSYLEFVKCFIPVSAKVDLTDKKTKNLYAVQTELIRNMYLVNSPTKILPTVMEFCKGDYLKFALGSLQSCIYKTPENEAKVFIDKLNESKALSVKKHALHLSCVIYDVATVHDFIKNTNIPSLVPALKYFAKNPSDSLWEVIEHKINEVEKKELQMCQSVVNIVVPLKYRSKFVEALWKLMDKHGDKEIKKTLITKIRKSTIQNLNSDFALSIIQDNIFKINESDDLMANMLLYVNDDRKFDVFTKVLREMKENQWNCPKTMRHTRRKLSRFIWKLFEKYMKAEEKDEKFVSELSKLFKSVFSLSETFEEYVIISCMAWKKESTENCSVLLREFNNDIVKNYTNYVVNLFANTLERYVFQHIFKTSDEKIKLCYSLFKMRKSADDDLLILSLLPRAAPVDTEHFVMYDEILKALKQSNDNMVQLKLNSF